MTVQAAVVALLLDEDENQDIPQSSKRWWVI